MGLRGRFFLLEQEHVYIGVLDGNEEDEFWRPTGKI